MSLIPVLDHFLAELAFILYRFTLAFPMVAASTDAIAIWISGVVAFGVTSSSASFGVVRGD